MYTVCGIVNSIGFLFDLFVLEKKLNLSIFFFPL